MSRSSRQREKYGDEGTAARTRPLSFDEIMLRRRNKELLGDVKEGSGGAGDISGKHIIEKASDHMESERGHDSVKASSWKKEDITSIEGDNLVNKKNKENRVSEPRLKSIVSKDIIDKSKRETIDKRVHGRRKNDQHSSDDAEIEIGKRHSRDLAGKDKYTERGRRNSEKEGKRRHHKEDDKQKESKRKDRSEYDERIRDKNAAKKHDSEFYERKERLESSKFHHEEQRPKRRRSRSRERNKDKDRRSTSLSPRVRKHTSYNVREHEELSSRSSKDKSGRPHSDVDRKKMSNNGSNSQYRRNDGFASGLGGYSPRKRKTDAAVRTPSPTTRSPEKKTAAWDLNPTGRDSNATNSVISNLQSSNQTAVSDTHELRSPVPAASTEKPPLRVFPSTYSTNMNASSDFIQLTEATRPMRQLYVENLPASASEKALLECINNFLLSLGVNHVDGTQRCISCIIHKEKHQALVEFLTPADASTALSFDGRPFNESILKIRRPKDFLQVTTGVPEKSVAAVSTLSDIVPDSPNKTVVPEKSVAALHTISDIVPDSPHKIFIGGISKDISSEMLRDILGAFGPLKAYHFEINPERNVPIAFAEYSDEVISISVDTLLGGLRGLFIGGQRLTVVQATPHASSMGYSKDLPFYDIPEHAKPLLEEPTQVLKLKHVFDPDHLSSLSELELEEILEDVRFECARFGTVMSINVIKHNKVPNTGLGPHDDKVDDAIKTGDIKMEDKSAKSDSVERDENHDSKVPNTSSGPHDDKADDAIKTVDIKMEDKSAVSDAVERDENHEWAFELGDVFAHGDVLVEFRRTEYACNAAHCLDGRDFDDRVVKAFYVPYDAYKLKFPQRANLVLTIGDDVLLH